MWDKKQNAYRDGVGTDHAPLHANMMTLAFKIVPAHNRGAVMNFMCTRGMACSVYAGDAEFGLSLLTSKGERGWHNIIRAGSTITTEALDTKYKPKQDWNHAWGAVPTNITPRKLMGIKALAPRMERIRVRPQIASLTSATIRVLTIRGPIELCPRQSARETVYG